ncbi:L-histidine N(alpha)-methyltransferase [Chlorogloeopsis sp. ULAP01]|uniref:L-histidine N(alpha)-methyltransferase n=1 Tax=Chlorogloeopsis sp. ULAP01 TaxID=3056483 RepID=UPI0025AAC306|nr:L-histidine N(alpha)-methyltransferase [Chlorogloeopsis sp. ULAP01]MDM9379937.1 L-histidine N(alpha)-methyltransferase [Chlorogloeopsis sp. ULAP01]
MVINSHSNSQLTSDISTLNKRIAKPSSDFYSIFSEKEVLGIIHALEDRREIPLKYSYKGRGAKIWDNFYLKYALPKWYRTSNVEIDLLKQNFTLIIDKFQNCQKINVIDVGAGNLYPVKQFIYRLNELGLINKYIALDISEDLLNISNANFKKWFPTIKFASALIDIEESCIPQSLLENQTQVENEYMAKIILHLGVTMGNHQNRTKVLTNLRNSMQKNDFLVFTNEIGSNSQWDGSVRGGSKYHAEQVYRWIQNQLGIKSEDCQILRKYDSETDSLVANMQILSNYTIYFNFMTINQNIEISAGEEITIWRHHKYEMPELLQEIEKAGLELVHYSTNKYLSHTMVICQIASN